MSRSHLFATLLLLFLLKHSLSMKVVGLGYPRTGTRSLKIALEHLGFRPAYQMQELLFEESAISTAGHFEAFTSAVRGEDVDLGELLREFDASTDFPAAALPQEMYASFPKAKFVLTVRPAEKWFASLSETLCNHATDDWFNRINSLIPVMPFTRLKLLKEFVDAVVRFRYGATIQGLKTWQDFCSNKDAAITVYNQHNAKVRQLIPEHQLFVADLDNLSYAELASFLGRDIPHEPFPHENSTDVLKLVILKLKIAAIIFAVTNVIIGCALVFLARRMLLLRKVKTA